ncbi:putative variant ionotropic glutamate receptor-like 16, partial [Homarus americanus]
EINRRSHSSPGRCVDNILLIRDLHTIATVTNMDMQWIQLIKHTDSEERGNIVKMWLAGMSVQKISQTMGVSITTVYRWVHRWLCDGNVNTKLHGRRNHLLKNSEITPGSLSVTPASATVSISRSLSDLYTANIISYLSMAREPQSCAACYSSY